MDLELKGKVAIVTGGSRGIGKAIARQLVKEGAQVALVARDRVTLDATVSEIGVQAKAFVADTGEDAAIKAMVAGVIEAFGRIDVLVNCAAKPRGESKPPGLAEITNQGFWEDMNVKVMGYLRTAREVAPHMIKQHAGRIINISGLGARSAGNILGLIRNVSVAALTKTLAEELGRHGISAVCVHPAETRTEKTPGVFELQAKAKGVSVAEIEKDMDSRNLIGKMITAEQIAHVVAFLASPKSIALNGDSVAAGGGLPGVIHY